MPSPFAMTKRLERLETTAADFARKSLSLLPLVFLVRVYERSIIGASHTLPAGAASLWWHAAASDVAYVLCVAGVLAVPLLLVAQWHPFFARFVHRSLLVLLTVLGVALAQYFAVTRVPLGADLYGYSLHDIRETIGASRGVSWASLVPFVLLGAVAWLMPKAALLLPWRRAASVAFYVCAFGALFVPSARVPSPASFSSDTEMFVAVNKSGWFATRSVRHFVARWRVARDAADLNGYPLMHRQPIDDVLGPQLALGAQRPSFVLVIVEGLGRDFTGPHAEYGGFTPFLDSLADRSLSWDNFLSTSGRTFGILPSLLGSLPFGETGFMELGENAPSHVSLISLLRAQGYATSYFTGTNGSFDRIDRFLDAEGIDRFVDASGFGAHYVRQPAGDGGESWGYPDGALFRRSLELLDPAAAAPRLDVYLTISTHEPFIPPNREKYRRLFERRLATLPINEARREQYRASSEVFETLLYTDESIRDFLQAYSTRADYGRTIFMITGDHRLIPVPPSSRVARYHVPFILFSPMLRAPRHVAAVSSHFDVAPSLLAMLQRCCGVTVPDSVAWLGVGLDTAATYRHAHRLPLMRTKNELDEYFDGTTFLSAGELFRVDSLFNVVPITDDVVRSTLTAELNAFRAVNRYTTHRDRLLSGPLRQGRADPAVTAHEDSVYAALDLERGTPVQAFEAARAAAGRQHYDTARAVLHRLLRDVPSYHDARALLARTYGWERRFDEARPVSEDLLRRAPEYVDGYELRIELEVWQGNGAAALIAAAKALDRFPAQPGLLYGKARALELLGRKVDALAALDELQRVAPQHPEASVLRKRLQAR